MSHALVADTKQKFFDTAQVARLFGRSVSSVKLWRSKGILPEPAKMLNGRAFWSEEQLDVFGAVQASQSPGLPETIEALA